MEASSTRASEVYDGRRNVHSPAACCWCSRIRSGSERVGRSSGGRRWRFFLSAKSTEQLAVPAREVASQEDSNARERWLHFLYLQRKRMAFHAYRLRLSLAVTVLSSRSPLKRSRPRVRTSVPCVDEFPHQTDMRSEWLRIVPSQSDRAPHPREFFKKVAMR